MANTIEGGAYRVNGAWVDAEGRPLKKDQIAQAQAIHADNEVGREQDERERIALEAQRNPTAQAIAAAMAPKSAKKASAE